MVNESLQCRVTKIGGGLWKLSRYDRAGASQPGLYRGEHRIRRNAVAVVQGRQGARVEKCVGQGDLAKCGVDTRTHQLAGHRLAQTADDAMVLGHDNQTAGPSRLAYDGGGVKRLE